MKFGQNLFQPAGPGRKAVLLHLPIEVFVEIGHFLQSGPGFLRNFFTGQLIYGQKLIHGDQAHFEFFEGLKNLVTDGEKLIKSQLRFFLPGKRVLRAGLV